MIREIRNAESKIKQAIRNSDGSVRLNQIIVQTQLPYHLAFSVAQMLRDRGTIKMEARPETNSEDFILRAVK
mgnify:CR=1 FL=1